MNARFAGLRTRASAESSATELRPGERMRSARVGNAWSAAACPCHVTSAARNKKPILRFTPSGITKRVTFVSALSTAPPTLSGSYERCQLAERVGFRVEGLPHFADDELL